MDEMCAERERKAKAIVGRYKDGRKYRQKGIADYVPEEGKCVYNE